VDSRELLRLIERFGEATVAVAGDLLADLYIASRPSGLSREAPVMILTEEGRWISPGGAANAMACVLSLSGNVLPVGVVGDDAAGVMLLEELEGRGMDTSGVIVAAGHGTYTKTRVFAGDLHTVKQQVMRIDRRPPDRVSGAVEKQVLAAIDKASGLADAWLVSDYDADFFTDSVISRLNGEGRSKILVVDSHRRLASFPGAMCVTPNEAEASLATGIQIDNDADAAQAARHLRSACDAEWVFLTRGNRGMMIAGRDGSLVTIPIVGPEDIVDVAGAGDTVAAVLALSFACDIEPVKAGVLAAVAASVVCMKTGVATVSIDEIRTALEKYPPPAVQSIGSIVPDGQG